MPSPCRALTSATGAPNCAESALRSSLAAAAAQIVGHIEDHQRGQAQRQDRRGQHQMAAQVGGIEHQQHGFGLGAVVAQAVQHVVGDLLVLRARRQAVDAGQIDDLQGAAVGKLHQARVLLDGDAGEIGHFLTQPGEAVEQGGLCRSWEGRSAATALGALLARGNSMTAAAPQALQSLHPLTEFLACRRAPDLQAPGGLAAQRDFRTIHLEDPRIAARSAAARGDAWLPAGIPAPSDGAHPRPEDRCGRGWRHRPGAGRHRVAERRPADVSRYCYSVASRFQYAASPKFLSRGGHGFFVRSFLRATCEAPPSAPKCKDNRCTMHRRSAVFGSVTWTPS